MWKRQCELDAFVEERPSIPTRIASNEEFVPPEQSAEQKEVELRLWAIAETAATKLNMSRRDFLRSSCGIAAGLMALNQVFGECYEVHADETTDKKKFQERWPKPDFIFDMQTHHVDIQGEWYDDSPDGKRLKAFVRLLRRANSVEESIELLNRDHYVKEMFFDSDTVMAMISGVPTRDWNKNPLPPDQMAATRDYVNNLAQSERVMSHGLLRPNLGPSELDEMERQVKELKIAAWKMYTGAELGEQAWWMDDEKIAYPCWEKTKQLGIKNLCVHKGLPLGLFNEEHCRPNDLIKAAKDWPELNFIVYHSGFRGFGPASRGLGATKEDPKSDDPQELAWTSDIFRGLRENPQIKNIYFELGSTFNQVSAFNPIKCLHMLGQMLQTAGPDNIIWGTDCIWGGSPQSQIERMRRLKMRDDLREKFGYPDLTAELKAKIFGLNAAKILSIDPEAKRQAINGDRFSQLRKEYQKNPSPSNTQYGWVWVSDDKSEGPTTPVGT